MALTSWDALIAALAAGQTEDPVFQKITANAAAGVAGRFYELFSASGVPGAGAFSGTAGVATAMTRSTQGALGLGPNVSTDVRNLINFSAWSPTATVVPAVLTLCDFLLYYPANVVTGTPTTLNNTVTLPRYTDGVGVMGSVFVQTVNGATAPALTLNFDTDANTGRTGVMTSPAASLPVSSAYLLSGSHYLPMGSGDKGVKKINSYTLATGTTGTVAFLLYKPLARIPILAINTASLANLVNEIPSMPRIYDGACLGFIIQAGGAMAASSVVAGSAQWAWD